MQVRKVSLSTGELSYFASGEGRPLLYLHPAGGVRWTRVLEGLAKSFALHVPVIPGFDGTSAHGAVKSMRGLASLVGEFIEKVMARPCDVIGCSFGGYLAAWLAAEHPKLVDHLVLECPAGLRPKANGPPTPKRCASSYSCTRKSFRRNRSPWSRRSQTAGCSCTTAPRSTRTRNSSRGCLRSTSSRSSCTAPPTG